MYVGKQIDMCKGIKKEELEKFVEGFNKKLIQKILLEKQNQNE